MKSNPQRRLAGLIVQQLQNETLVYDCRRHQAHCLNQTAALIWRHCDGHTPVAEIASALSRDLQTPVADRVVWYALREFERHHLLETELMLPPAFIAAGLNRRQMVQALGLAAVVAVPLVTSIMAPTPVQAATCVPSGGACTSGAECCSGLCSANVCA